MSTLSKQTFRDRTRPYPARFIRRPQPERLEWYEHREQARAPHTNRPRNVPRCGALSLFQKTLHCRGGDRGAQAIVRGGARCASQELHRCAHAVARGGARCVLQVLGRGCSDRCSRRHART
jgi:hypothetical protein